MLNIINILDNSITGPTTDCMGLAIPDSAFNLVATIINGIKIVVPILLIIWGMLDFAKSIIAKKEDEIKEYQKLFIKRLVSAILVFLVVFIVQLIVNLISGVQSKSGVDTTQSSSAWECTKLFIKGVEVDGTNTIDAE